MRNTPVVETVETLTGCYSRLSVESYRQTPSPFDELILATDPGNYYGFVTSRTQCELQGSD